MWRQFYALSTPSLFLKMSLLLYWQSLNDQVCCTPLTSQKFLKPGDHVILRILFLLNGYDNCIWFCLIKGLTTSSTFWFDVAIFKTNPKFNEVKYDVMMSSSSRIRLMRKTLVTFLFTIVYYTIIDLCWGRHEVLLNSKRHIDRRGAEVNMIKFTVQ